MSVQEYTIFGKERTVSTYLGTMGAVESLAGELLALISTLSRTSFSVLKMRLVAMVDLAEGEEDAAYVCCCNLDMGFG